MKKVISYICITAFLFATMEVVLKIGGQTFDAWQLTGLRFFIGGVVLAPFALKEYRENYLSAGRSLTLRDYSWLLAVGIVCIPVSMLLFQIGIVHCNASTAAPIICMNPVFTMVIAHIFTSEKMDGHKWISLAIGIIATVLMIRPWNVQEGNTAFGLTCMVLAAITFAIYTVMGKQSLERIGLFTQTSLSFIMGSVALLIITGATGRPVLAHVADAWPIVAFCGVAVTGIGYMFYFLSIKLSDAVTGSLAFFIKPAIAPVLAIAILHENVEWNTVAGVILLLAASFITIKDSFNAKRLRIAEANL